MAGRRTLLVALSLALTAARAPAQQEAAVPAPATGVPLLAINSPTPTAAEIQAAFDRALAWLVAAQNADGSWGGVRNMSYTDLWPNVEAHRSWTVATTGLAVMTLLRHAEDDVHGRTAVASGIDYLIKNHDLRRCDDWDSDNVWGLLYGLQGLSCALAHPWYAKSTQRPAMQAACTKLLKRIGDYQSPTGGWAYYTDQIDAWRPQWSTSFTTAAMIDALVDARAAGFDFEHKRFDAALRAVERCKLPSGAFTYDVMALPEPGSLEGINDLRGSLGRIQVCNFALIRGGRPVTEAAVARGLDQFFLHHLFLDCARMRPIPHEAYHYNAGYFYLFGHFYAGELLARLPMAARKDDAFKLAFEVMKTQEKSGAAWDYYMADYTKNAGTAFAAMTLGRVLAVVGPSKP